MTNKDMVVTIMVKHFWLKNYLIWLSWRNQKSDIVVAVEEWKTDDDPSEYNFLICDILNLSDSEPGPWIQWKST